MKILGIDPGLHGGYALLDGAKTFGEPLPISARELDRQELAIEFSSLEPAFALVERAASRPGQGVCSMFSFGKIYGEILGILSALAIPFYIVDPREWRAVLGSSGTPEAGLTHRQRRKALKAASVAYVRQAFPSVRLIPAGCKRPHDGIADAVCIASYGAQRFSTEGKRAA